MLAIGQSETIASVAPGVLVDRLAAVVKHLLGSCPIERLFVEGGATAGVIARQLGWSRLLVVEQPAPGVVTLVPTGPAALPLTVKVGSYAWPDDVYAEFS